MKYEEFCSIIKSEVNNIDLSDKYISSALRQSYKSLPRGLTQKQQEAYVKTWASGFILGRLSGNMRSREIMSGLVKRIDTDPKEEVIARNRAG